MENFFINLAESTGAPGLAAEFLRPDLHTARLALGSDTWQALFYQHFVTRRFKCDTGFVEHDMFNCAAHSARLVNQTGRATVAVLRDYAEHLVVTLQLYAMTRARDGHITSYYALPDDAVNAR